jgi:hypothetical protein
MNRLSLAVAALGVFAAAAPAAAQQTPPPLHPPFSRSPMALDRHMDNIRHAQQAEFEAFLAQAEEPVLDQPLERIDLANRVSGLIQLGQCAEARALANEAGDRQMAIRVRQICRTRRP